MNSFFKNIGLYDYLNFNIKTDKSEFLESLKKITYETNTSFISLTPDHGIPTRFEYRGLINKDTFILKRSLKRDKYNFERELNFIVQKSNQFKSYQ